MRGERGPVWRRDTGAALLSVLLVVAAMSVVVLIAVDAVSRATRLAALTNERTEHFWVTRSAEAAGLSYVARLLENTDGRLNDATPLVGEVVTQPLDSGTIALRLDEATNCFNLNALAETSELGWTADEREVERLQALFEARGFGPYESDQLAHSIADWIDTDTVSRPAGAEDAYYAGLEPSYRTAGTPLENIRELKSIGPFIQDSYDAVQAITCVRPDVGQSVLNLNTLRPDQAALLTAFFSSELAEDTAREVIEARPLGGWEDVAEFLELPEIQQISAEFKNPSAIDIVSSFFSLSGEVVISQQTTRFELLYGVDETDTAKLLWRRYGED